MLLQLSQFFSLCPTLHDTPIPSSNPPLWFMSMGHTYKFFGFSISYIINTPLSILYLQIMLLNPCACSPLLPFPPPADTPPNDLNSYDSVPVLVVCFVWVFLGSVVDSCEFVAFLMLIVLNFFFFLNKFL